MCALPDVLLHIFIKRVGDYALRKIIAVLGHVPSLSQTPLANLGWPQLGKSPGRRSLVWMRLRIATEPGDHLFLVPEGH